MTNEEKYRTPEDRAEACRKFCNSKQCNECECAKDGRRRVSLCEFRWLDLEAKDEKLLACPFCGSTDVKVIRATISGHVVTCDNCWAASRAEATRADAIAAWNRRAE